MFPTSASTSKLKPKKNSPDWLKLWISVIAIGNGWMLVMVSMLLRNHWSLASSFKSLHAQRVFCGISKVQFLSSSRGHDPNLNQLHPQKGGSRIHQKPPKLHKFQVADLPKTSPSSWSNKTIKPNLSAMITWASEFLLPRHPNFDELSKIHTQGGGVGCVFFPKKMAEHISVEFKWPCRWSWWLRAWWGGGGGGRVPLKEQNERKGNGWCENLYESLFISWRP